MSTSSFDDSSNLFDKSSPPNGEKKDYITDEKDKDTTEETPEPETETHHSRSKASKAIKFLKRAKSPLSGQLKAAKSPFKSLRNLPKHHYKAPKSPSKSPSKENLTEEFKNLEQKLGEKKTEEWKEFQQMQERIKQTVLKTQTSLHKYTAHGDDSEGKQSKWTGFEEEESLEPEEIIDVSSGTPEINISWASYDNDDNSKKLIDTSKDLSHLDTTPVPSPPVTPAPPYNSRISSMENLTEASDKKQTVAADEFDLLGLGSSSEPAAAGPQQGIMNQDLLGLDNDFLGTGPTGGASDILGGYSYSVSSVKTQSEKSSNRSTPVEFDPNMTISDAESEFYLTQKPAVTQDVGSDSYLLKDQPEAYNFDALSSVSDLITGHTKATDLTGFIHDASDVSKTDEYNAMLFTGTEKDSHSNFDTFGGLPVMEDPLEPTSFSVEHTDQVVPQSMQSVQSSEKVLDDLADLDPMKADISSLEVAPPVSNLYGSPTSPINIVQSANTSFPSTQGNIYGTSPQSMGTAFGSYPSSHVPIQQDILSKIQKMSSGSQPVSPARRKLAPKAPDPFGFVKKELKKPEADQHIIDDDEEEYKPIVRLVKDKKAGEIVASSERDTSESESIPNVENNPFLSGDFGAETYSNEGFNSSVDVAAVFGVESIDKMMVDQSENIPVPAVDTSSTEQWTNLNEGSFKDTWHDMDETKTGFESDHVWDAAKPQAQGSGDAWGSAVASENIVDATEISTNPFQDDFSAFDENKFDVSKNISEFESGNVSANPFLDENIVSASAVIPDATSNPFLDLDTADIMKGSGAAILDESLFLDSLGETKIENIPVAMDDDFDPFKVSEPKEIKSDSQAPDDIDLFISTTSSGDKKISKPYNDDDKQGFVLEIKPVAEKSESDSAVPAPALKPPPKAPKSPQPPRENPFDRDSPPEENFAQFEIMDTEKPKEPLPKSFSSESSTTEEEENLEPLEPYLPKCEKDGFKLMLRYPTKKKITGNRYWKNVFVKLEKQKEGPMVRVFSDQNDALPLQELLLQACYSLSDCCLQQYDQYGKIHTVKLQYIFYKERVGIKTDRIAPSIVKLRNTKPKANMIMDHSPQVSELLKFGSLDRDEMVLFMQEVEDTLMNLEAHREKTLTYTKDEVTAELHDEYKAELDKHGKVLMQKARVRIFVLAFLTGMPTVEVGLNDKRRRGKEVVGRSDIIPIKTEEWIKLEDVEFHCCVDREEFEKTNNIKFHPLDACQFELMRYRVRLRENKELPMQLTIQQIFKDRKMEVRCDLLVTGYHSFSKKHGQFPCEDIEVRFPVPEMWIYMFRYERRFGYGAFKSTTRKPGKIKGRLFIYSRICLNKICCFLI